MCEQERQIVQFVEEQDGILLNVFAEIGEGDGSELEQREAALALARDSSAILLVTTISRLTRFCDYLTSLYDDGISVQSTVFPDHGLRELCQQARHALARCVDDDEHRDMARAEAIRQGRPWGGRAADHSGRAQAADAFARCVYPVIYWLRKRGFSSNRSIANELNRIGVKTRTGSGRWHSKTVGRVMERARPDIDVRFPRQIVERLSREVFESEERFEEWCRTVWGSL